MTLSREIRNQTEEYINRGYSRQKIAELQNISYSAAVYRVKARKIFPRRFIGPKQLSDRDLQIILRFNYGKGETALAISKSLKITRERVRQILEKNGIAGGSHRNLRATRILESIKVECEKSPIITDYELSQKVGMSAVTISGYRRRYNLKADETQRLEFRARRRLAKFWSRIDITADPNECWNWTGPVNSVHRYPHSSKMDGINSNRAQVIVWNRVYGPPKENVSNTCDSKICCNWNHLADASNIEIIEKRERGYKAGLYTRPRGSKGKSKYDPETRALLRKLRATMTNKELSEMTGFPLGSIYNITNRVK